MAYTGDVFTAMVRTLQIYRFCLLDEAQRPYFEFKLSCADDLEAAHEAGSISDTNGVEVWDQARLVARIDSRP